MKKKRKALVLLSGGLDSILAAKILMEQGIKVTGLIFKSSFFDAESGIKAAKQLTIPYSDPPVGGEETGSRPAESAGRGSYSDPPVGGEEKGSERSEGSYRVVDFSEKHLEMVKNPAHGYGKAANPCIDCHLLMLRTARRIMEKEGWDFVATGEVLGERPFSQNKQALELIAKESGMGNRLLRPLSAKLLFPTLPEENGWVDRDKLLDIQGRQRQPQIGLAKKYKLSYPTPSGGCILCEKKFAEKLFDLFEKWPQCDTNDVELLKLGRQFWHGRTKIVLGRNKEENIKLGALAQDSDIILKPTNFPGPTALIRGEAVDPKIIEEGKSLILRYSKKAPKNAEITALPTGS